jgi:hypothetical protein
MLWITKGEKIGLSIAALALSISVFSIVVLLVDPVPDKSPIGSAIGIVAGLTIVAAPFYIFCILPTIVAFYRRHPDKIPIMLINIGAPVLARLIFLFYSPFYSLVSLRFAVIAWFVAFMWLFI